MNEKLTGRVRVRARLVGGFVKSEQVLVLQVQANREDGPADANGAPEYLAATYWRDAVVEDLCSPDFPSTLWGRP